MRLFVLFCLVAGCVFAQEEHAPKLLLNAQRVRRLKRDRERATVRWTNFEGRVKGVPDSPERGFELALYFAITGDAESGNQASAWANAHPCEIRQVSLIADWVGAPVPAASKQCRLKAASEVERLRDAAFLAIASGERPAPSGGFIPAMTQGGFRNAVAFYAAIEYLDAIRSATREDLRQQSVTYFADLPNLLLLSLSPEQLAHPAWQMHAAALALVSLDPNLEGSQFLQSWAMEDPQTVQEGPGVGYELLWADPYLPGVSYHNMEPALYEDKESTLIARSSWEDDACRVEIRPGKVHAENCPADWQSKRMDFGHLALIPVSDRCIELGTRPNNSVTIIWKLNAEAKLVYSVEGKQQARSSDAAGMWRVAIDERGKVCSAR